MGMNLCVSRVSFAPFSAADLHISEWDCSRMAGDREFVDAFGREFPIESRWLREQEMGYERPMDFGSARAWVRVHIPWEDNAARLLDMLGRMEREPDLWFRVGV